MNKKKDDFLIEEMKKESEKSNEGKEKESIFFDFDFYMFMSIVKILVALMIFFACFVLFKSTLEDLSEVSNGTNFETETADTATQKNDYDTNDFLTDYYIYKKIFGGSYYDE